MACRRCDSLTRLLMIEEVVRFGRMFSGRHVMVYK